MATAKYTIEYQFAANVELRSATATKGYLQSEAEVWGPFLDELRNFSALAKLPRVSDTLNSEVLARAFETYSSKVGDVNAFNRLSNAHFRSTTLPPPSSSVEGQLILGLLENGRHREAMSVYSWFIHQDLQIQYKQNRQLEAMINEGRQLGLAAHAAAALPFQKVNSRRMSAAARSAESQLSAISEILGQAEAANEKHDSKLEELANAQVQRFNELEKGVLNGAEEQNRTFDKWMAQRATDLQASVRALEEKTEELNNLNTARQNDRETEFQQLLELFHTQLRLRAPVELWKRRENAHSENAQGALVRFGVLTVGAIAFGLAVPFFAGDYIAGSFFVEFCDDGPPPTCERVFSAKGPLTIAGLLVVASLLLWTIRLQYRLYLSERHLALDASEKKAFAETFMAMKEGEDVSEDNEAIVLASLFRPTQDGIIKDDEGVLDPSIAALLARQLGR